MVHFSGGRSPAAPAEWRAAAISGDGSRIGVAWTDPGSAARIALGDAGGAWTSSTVFATYWDLAFGFNAAGKLWVVDGLGQFTGPPAEYLLYEER